jgi:hypothetical protein
MSVLSFGSLEKGRFTMRTVMRTLKIALIFGLMLGTLCLAGTEDLEVTGDVRLRLRYIDSGSTDSLSGTYGELVKRGFSQRHRLVLEVAYPIAGSIRVGGLIRVSNEDEEVLEAGPEYLSSEFGSAFIAYETPALTSRFGYYPVSFGPLSLMRWDLNDDPEGGGGGCAVCGGPGVAGAILGETLEELGPNLTFEGLKADYAPAEMLGFSTFFARPTISGETYPVVTYGGRAGFKHYLKRTSSFLDVALLAVRSEDDRKSLEGVEPVGSVFSSTVYGITWKVPVLRMISLDGEWTLSRSEGEDLSSALARPWEQEGVGGIFSLSANVEKQISLDASYIYLSPNWDSFFRALSYNANRRGLRFRAEYNEERLLIALFAKYLRTIDPVFVAGYDVDQTVAYPTLSARGYLRITPNLNLGVAAIYSGEGVEEEGVTLDVDNKRITWLGALTFEFTKDSSITLEERYVQNRSDTEADQDVSLLSLYVRAAIW